jgi:hypothetical protein
MDVLKFKTLYDLFLIEYKELFSEYQIVNYIYFKKKYEKNKIKDEVM